MSEATYTPEQVQALADSLVELYGKDEVVAALKASLGPRWPTFYFNRDRGPEEGRYKPHHLEERFWVESDTPRYLMAKGGEGGGKSVAGIIKTLERVRRGCSGIMVSPDLPHFKRSLWPEFQRWCPWDQVVDKHRNRGKFDWEPYAPFVIAFRNGAKLWCGGMDEPGAWEGPNVNFAHMDEMRRKKEAHVLKVLDGRVRIPTNGIPPQIWQTSTPRKHWFFEFYGPLKVRCTECGSTRPIAIQEGEPYVCKDCTSAALKDNDERAAFKHDSLVITLLTSDNESNLQEGFAKLRAQSLTESEARVLLEAAWEDIDEGQQFLPHISWWDDCKEELPPLTKSEPLVVALDAATGRTSGLSDCFGMLAVGRHPDPSRRHDTVAVCYTKTWQAPSGGKIDFLGTEHNPGPERELLRLCGWTISANGEYTKVGDGYNIKCVAHDPQQLHDLAMRFMRKRIVWMYEFSQGSPRVEADVDLLRLIQSKRIVHDGDSTLREHLQNADRKSDDQHRKFRMVKREDTLKIDLAVCLSMAAERCLYLTL